MSGLHASGPAPGGKKAGYAWLPNAVLSILRERHLSTFREPSVRDTQAARHQNLVGPVERTVSVRGQSTRPLKALGVSRKKLDGYLDNPLQRIPDRLARRCEAFLNKPSRWMDEQHVETDPVCASFREDTRRLMMVPTDLPALDGRRLLAVAEVFVERDD